MGVQCHFKLSEFETKAEENSLSYEIEVKEHTEYNDFTCNDEVVYTEKNLIVDDAIWMGSVLGSSVVFDCKNINKTQLVILKGLGVEYILS